MPEAPAPDPPGYYMGWPLAGLPKRVVAGFLDYVVFFFLALVVAAMAAAVVRRLAGADAGAVASFFLLFAAYGAFLYNFSVLQNRTGQTWGNRIVGVRSVTMVELRPPGGKLLLGLKPFFEALEIVTGVAFVAIAFSYYRQTLSDKFCGIVVIDERRAGKTLPWVLPGAPAMQVAPPVPQGGVPLPERRGRKSPPAPPPAWAEVSEPPPPPEPDELPEPEVEDRPRDRRGVRSWQDALADPPTRAEAQAPRATDLDDPSAAEVAKEPPPPPRPTPEAPAQHEAPDDDGPPNVSPPLPKPQATAPSHDTADDWSDLDGIHYFTDPDIADAIRAGDLKLANERAQEALEVYWEQQLPVDIAEAVAEYRALIRRAGKAIRADDATIAGWLGLG